MRKTTLKLKETINQKFDNNDNIFSAEFSNIKNSMIFFLNNLLAKDLENISKSNKEEYLSNLNQMETKFLLLTQKYSQKKDF